MSGTQYAMMVVMTFFWIPGVIYILYKYVQIKNSEIVIGKVINIEPVYRGAKYTFEIQYKEMIETKTISPNTAFQQYHMDDEIELYRIERDGFISYFVKGSNYTVALVAMAVSFFFFIVSLGA